MSGTAPVGGGRPAYWFVLVPQGLSSCSHCLMMASFGPRELHFDNADEIGLPHIGCFCEWVLIDALDEWLADERILYARDRYEAAVEALKERYPDDPKMWSSQREIQKEIARQQPYWDAAIYRAEAAAGSDDIWLMYSELAKRDPKWIYQGYESRRSWKEFDEHEKATVARLQTKGYFPFVVERSNTDYVKSYDVILKLFGKETAWEIKNVQGSGKWTVHHAFRDARGKGTDRIIIDFTGNPLLFSELEGKALMEFRNRSEFNEMMIVYEKDNEVILKYYTK